MVPVRRCAGSCGFQLHLAFIQHRLLHGARVRHISRTVLGELLLHPFRTWPDPVFCTRCYESVSTDSSSSGLPLASSTFLARSAVFANCAGVWKPNALCGLSWL